ncbi:MAG TPA: hypothetical protein VGI93_20045 [Steroidobacteraceae bacterium]
MASVLLMVVSAFEWSLVDLLTPFLFLPLRGLAWLIFVTVSVCSVVRLMRNMRHRRAAVPAVICVVALGLVIFVPFTNLWLRLNFTLNRSAREHVVRDVSEGRLAPSMSYANGGGLITLPSGAPRVSNGGNEIETKKHDGKIYVFFYTFRGILSRYAGFLYVPTGGDPNTFSDLNEERRTIIERYDDHWFFVSHH